MVWGGVSKFGKTPLIVIEKTLDSSGYCEVLKDYKNWLSKLGPISGSASLLHDNARMHVSAHTNAYLQQEGIQVVPNWPANSPDLNPIELVWAWMSGVVKKMRPKTKAELVDVVNNVWDSLTQDMIDNFVNAVPKRMEAVYRSNGEEFKK
jgi:hypothetical protein